MFLEHRLGLVGPGGFGRAGNDRDLEVDRQLASGQLVAEPSELRCSRAHEADSRALASVGEGGVLAQEAIARVDGIAVFALRNRHDLGHVEVGCGPGSVESCEAVRASDV